MGAAKRANDSNADTSIVSAPTQTVRHPDRSSPASRSGGIRRAAYANANEGEAECFAWPGPKHSSHRSGFLMNCSGRISHRSAWFATGKKRQPMSPMSWWSGSHDATPSPVRQSVHRPSMARLPAKLSQVTRTPRGCPVEPEVNCSSATGPAGLGSSSSCPSRSTQGAPGRPDRASAAPISGANSSEVIVSAGAACSMMAATWRMYSSAGWNDGGTIGQTVAPAAHTP